jgi:hypothetical protein
VESQIIQYRNLAGYCKKKGRLLEEGRPDTAGRKAEYCRKGVRYCNKEGRIMQKERQDDSRTTRPIEIRPKTARPMTACPMDSSPHGQLDP